ncbi:MAG: ROK family protein [Bacteroidales bacterium]|nr:ROK family protein [Bacteroidales bacterium]
MKNNRIILLDVGGTFIKSSLGVACKGALEGTFMSTPMSSDGTAEEITNSFREAVSAQTRRAAEEGFTIDAVCAAIPGPFNYKEGIFLMKHKFAAVYGKSFREILGDVITPDTRLAFAHDVNGALLGAIMADPSLKEGVVAMCTLGTGLGFAHAIQGQVQESEMGSPARNIWNQPYLDSIVEDYASRRAILRFYAENGGVLAEGEDVKEIAMRARAGEENAADAFRQAGRHLAAGAAELVKELGVRYILFGGQISRSFDLMEEEVRKGLPAGVQISVSPDIQGMVLIGASSLV